MAKVKAVWAVAKSRGQTPDKVWHEPGGLAFRVDKDLFSDTWMKKVTEKEAEKLEAKRLAHLEATMTPEQREIAALKAENAALKAELAGPSKGSEKKPPPEKEPAQSALSGQAKTAE